MNITQTPSYAKYIYNNAKVKYIYVYVISTLKIYPKTCSKMYIPIIRQIQNIEIDLHIITP